MKLLSLQVRNIRNIEEIVFEPDSALTVIYGKNGQGKTNLLESVWLLTGAKSFRGAKDAELVRKGCDFGTLDAHVASEENEKHILLTVGGPQSPKRGRYASVNQVDYGRATAIAGIFTAVVFEPGHLRLVKEGPDGRRRFLDAALCQLYPGYIGTLRRFSRAMSQKNALLREAYAAPVDHGLLDAFDEELAASGEEITRRRAAYLQQTGPAAQHFYSELTGGVEHCEIRFLPCCEPGQLAAKLAAARKQDLRQGRSSVGPQREDFELLIEGASARVFGSQGQQRSAALCLKLAEAATAHDVTGNHPVLLLDDVLSELDEGRRAYLLKRMEGRQSIVTSCEAADFGSIAGKLVKIEAGAIEKQENI